MSSENLLSLKYSDLQKLAKSHGIKANQKSEKLIEALKSITDKKSSKEANDPNKTTEYHKQTDHESESLDENETPKSRKRLSVGGASQSSAKKSNQKNKSRMSTPKKVESPNKLSKRPPSSLRKKAIKRRTPVTERNEKSSGNMQDVSVRRNSSRRSSQKKEISAARPTLEIQEPPKKRSRDDSESEQMEQPLRKRLRSSTGAKNVLEEKTDVAKQQTSIPRYSKSLKVQKKTAEYWSKLHQKNQEKMESIDDYQKKKHSRAAVLLSGRKGKVASGLKSPETRKSPRLTAVVKPLNSKVFMPEVFTIDKMDLNFGKKAPATRGNSTVKTLNGPFTKGASPGFKTPRKQSPKKDVGSNRKSLMFSPKALNTSMLSATKNKFDLAASLERPLTWVPYKGKIKPLREETNYFRVEVKEVKTRSKQERIAEVRTGWKSRRASELMKKRNIK